MTSKVVVTAVATPPPVTWHFRQAVASWGSSLTPIFRATSAAAGVESTA